MARYTDRRGPGLSGRILEDLDLWRGQGKVYWIGDLDQMRRLLPRSDQLQVLATVKMASPERRAPPPSGPRPPRASPPRSPQDSSGRDDAVRIEPGKPASEKELALVEWTRSNTQP